MATIKSYSDLQQSKKLAEILPIESADLYYTLEDFVDEDTGDIFSIEKVSLGTPSDKEIGCWSLASLLDMLPKRIEIVDNVYELSVYLYGLYYWNISNGNLCFESKDKDNLVDACCEMILKLHESNLL